jgi:Immunoglobulin I-set domain.
VYNTCGSVTSQLSHVTVNIVPVIVQQPIKISTCVGENVSFTVIATGDSLYYQWKKNGFNIPGATQSTLTFNPVSYTDTASYSCLVYNTCGSVLSDAAYLNINVPPVIQTQPSSLLTCVGDIDFFHIDVTGDSLFYQWRFEESNIPGATSQDHLINPVTLADIGVYDVIVWNTCGTVVSDTAHLYANIDPAVIV